VVVAGGDVEVAWVGKGIPEYQVPVYPPNTVVTLSSVGTLRAREARRLSPSRIMMSLLIVIGKIFVF
jgi:hypothetical protein